MNACNAPVLVMICHAEDCQMKCHTAARMLIHAVSPDVLLVLATAGFGLQGYDTVSHDVAAA